MDEVQHTLLQCSAVKSFDLLFHRYEDDESEADASLRLARTTPWKNILACSDVPLALWPYILESTKDCYENASHSSLDALFFLVREKSPVLLQNIHRRRIRKRKRFQFE